MRMLQLRREHQERIDGSPFSSFGGGFTDSVANTLNPVRSGDFADAFKVVLRLNPHFFSDFSSSTR